MISGKQETRLKAFPKKKGKFETIVLTDIWNDLVDLINKTSISLHNNTMSMNVATKFMYLLPKIPVAD